MFIDGTSVRDDRPTQEELASITEAPCLERAEAAFESAQLNKAAFVFTLCEAGLFIDGELYDRFTKAIVFGHLKWLYGAKAMQERHEMLLRQVHANFAMRINHSHRALSKFIVEDPAIREDRKPHFLEAQWFMQHQQLEVIGTEYGNAMREYRRTLASLKELAWESARRRPANAIVNMLTPPNTRIKHLQGLVEENHDRLIVMPRNFNECLSAPQRLAAYRERRQVPRPRWLVSSPISKKDPA